MTAIILWLTFDIDDNHVDTPGNRVVVEEMTVLVHRLINFQVNLASALTRWMMSIVVLYIDNN